MTQQQLDKLRNTIVYLAPRVYDATKTKILKLVYLCEELSIVKHGVPFFGFDFYAWKFGPVQKELWENLNPNVEKGLEPQSFFFGFVKLENEGQNLCVVPLVEFKDDEFSERDIEIMDSIIDKYKSASAKDLIGVTHRNDGLWDKTISKVPGLKEDFDSERKSKSDLQLDFRNIIPSKNALDIYEEELEFLHFSNFLKKST